MRRCGSSLWHQCHHRCRRPEDHPGGRRWCGKSDGIPLAASELQQLVFQLLLIIVVEQFKQFLVIVEQFLIGLKFIVIEFVGRWQFRRYWTVVFVEFLIKQQLFQLQQLFLFVEQQFELLFFQQLKFVVFQLQFLVEQQLLKFQQQLVLQWQPGTFRFLRWWWRRARLRLLFGLGLFGINSAQD